jgi:hypothetical protein
MKITKLMCLYTRRQRACLVLVVERRTSTATAPELRCQIWPPHIQQIMVRKMNCRSVAHLRHAAIAGANQTLALSTAQKERLVVARFGNKPNMSKKNPEFLSCSAHTSEICDFCIIFSKMSLHPNFFMRLNI